jgi:uncharacterized membrane protein YhhN
MTSLRAWQRCLHTGLISLLIAGLSLSYLLAPLIHHLLFTPPEYRYITSAANLFARSPEVQGLAWGVTILIAVLTVQARRSLQRIYFSEPATTTE